LCSEFGVGMLTMLLLTGDIMCGHVGEGASHVYPVFVLDPWYLAPDPTAPSPGSMRVGVNRIRFLLQSLENLDENLRKHGSRLLLLHGNPTTVIPALLGKVKRLASASVCHKNCTTALVSWRNANCFGWLLAT
jgi:deoxyribodipyrimidine photolyase